jgi:hypothetical protein
VTTVTAFPRAIHRVDPVCIPLKDGTRHAPRMWLRVDADQSPVPAIIEAFEGDQPVRTERWERSIPRDLV